VAIRDLSPTVWASPGTAQISLNAILTALGFDTVPLDVFVSNYSPSQLQTINLSSGFNEITVPDTTNQRGLFLFAPRGNTGTWTVKGITGDTGLEQNPNGFFATTFDGSAPATIGVTTGGAITGFLALWW
jgi:hypothetical protein